MTALVPYFFTAGYFLERSNNLAALSSYTIAVGLHLVGFGHDQKEDNGEKYTYWVVSTLAVVLIAGTITSFFYKFNELTLDLLLAFVTGVYYSIVSKRGFLLEIKADSGHMLLVQSQ